MEKDAFKKVEKLYHYTSFDNCIKILLTKTLLFGRICNLNDINELYRPLFSKSITPIDIELFRKEINKYQQLSLTQDNDHHNKMGFDIPPMWGHYADKGRGVCLVFNKQELLKNKPDYVLEGNAIDYDPTYSPDIHLSTDDNGTLCPFSKQEIHELFFEKNSDWSYEQEFRLIAKNNLGDERLSYDLLNSLEGIIMRRADDISPEQKIFASRHFTILKNILGGQTINNEVFWSRRIWQYGNFINERNLCDYEGNSPWSISV